MELSSSLDIASNAIQIADFSAKLWSRVREIYESETGRSTEYEWLLKEAQRLRDVNVRLKSLLAEENLGREPSAAEENIISICTDCDLAGEQLLEILNDISDIDPLKPGKSEPQSLGPPSPRVRLAWRALQTACREMWKQRDIGRVLKRIESLKQSLASTMIVNIQRGILESNQSPPQIPAAGLEWDVAQPVGQWIESKHLDTKDCQDKLVNLIIQASNHRVGKDGVTEPAMNGTWSGSAAARRLLETILKVLEFEEMKHREYRIPPNFASTFQWIYEKQSQEPQNQSQLWDNFVDWLTSKKSLYWITGKAGSGKSTLTKMINQDPRTKTYVRQWSKDAPLVSASFFFWNSGSTLQMSQEGFLRSILHQVITQRLNYTLGSLQSRLEAFALSIYQTKLPQNELLQLFRILVEEDTSTKYFFLFDGLDEFEKREGIATLIKLVHTLGSYSHVKLCVSSRPWVEFQDSFKRQPSLMLERLTFDDIQLYVRGKLSTHPAFKEFSHGDPEYAQRLVHNITTKASGVFLWVVLTVRSLIEGLANGDRLANLEARLNELPGELEELFRKILHDLNGPYFSDAAHLFKIYQGAGAITITVLTLSFADEAEVNSVLSMPRGPLSPRERYQKATTMKRRLNSRCKGLIEIKYTQSDFDPSSLSEREIDDYMSNPSPSDSDIEKVGQALGDLSVQYLHRTVKDYLEAPKMASLIENACSSERLSPQLSLCLGQVCQLKTFTPRSLREVSIYEPLRRALLEFLDFASRLCLEDKKVYIRMMDESGMAIKAAGILPRHASEFWSNMCVKPGDEIEVPNFLAFAAYYDFITYVEEKLKQSNAPSELATQLLRTAVSRRGQRHSISLPPFDPKREKGSSRPQIDLVELLLRYGADANHQTNSISCVSIIEQRKKGSSKDEKAVFNQISEKIKNEKRKKRMARIMKIFG